MRRGGKELNMHASYGIIEPSITTRIRCKQTVKLARISTSILLVVAAAFAVYLPVSAVDYGNGAQGYAAESPLDNGTIVQLTGKDAKAVKPATQSQLQDMFGVTIDRGQLPVTLSSEGLENEVYVAASGTYNVLVSTQGGSIAKGDYVTLSAIDGIAMKAGTDEKTVFGRAIGTFDGKGVTLGQTSLKDTSGKANKTVTLGSVPVTIDIKTNPNEKSTKVKVPEALERIGQAIAEKEVSAIRIYLSMGITAVSLIAAIAVLYSGVRSGVISIGRNPMSKKSIFRALLEIILTSVLILIIGLFAVYLLLKL